MLRLPGENALLPEGDGILRNRKQGRGERVRHKSFAKHRFACVERHEASPKGRQSECVDQLPEGIGRGERI